MAKRYTPTEHKAAEAQAAEEVLPKDIFSATRRHASIREQEMAHRKEDILASDDALEAAVNRYTRGRNESPKR